MRTVFAVLTCVVLGIALTLSDWTAPVFSQESGQNPPETIIYKPPVRGAPAGGGRIVAGVRGEQGDSPTLLALAPDHVGVTSRKQPVLYWYISKPTTSHIEFALNDELRGKTVIRADLPSPKQAGIQAINLSDYKAELAPDVVYQWFVTIEVDPAQPAKDVYHGGSIIYREPSPDLEKSVQAAGVTGAAGIYAAQGFWYDAFYAARARGKKGEDGVLRQEQISLLKQVGYGVAAPGKEQLALTVEKNLLQYMSK